MKRTEIVKLQAVSLVFLMVASGLIVMINFQPEEVKGQTYYNSTWVITSNYTIDVDETVYVDDDLGYDVPPDTYSPHTGVVIGKREQPVTLTVKGTLVVDEGNIHVGCSEEMGMIKSGKIVVDGGTIRFNCPTIPYAIIGHGGDMMDGSGDIEIINGATVTNNGTGTGEFRFMANASLTIKNSTISHLAGSGILTTEPLLKVYTGGIHIEYPREGDTSNLSYLIQNASISDSKVGISFENFPGNIGYFEGISFDNCDTELNFTRGSPTLHNSSSSDAWTISIQDIYRESEMPGKANASHPVLVNCGYVDKDDVDIFTNETLMILASDSTVNVSAWINITVKNQAGGPVAGASVTLEESEYDMSEDPIENGK
ncbi:MAG: hypothetical protein KAU14_05700, partial [Thermoplasmata archaeon]|nr:hypothetical protein [Thermoplasmata archaeon]